MTGSAYADLVAFYVSRRFEDRSLKVYREIQIGKTIIGKNRHVDIFCICERTNRAFAIECKFQESIGTVDEKIPYALEDLKAFPMAGCIAYAGGGFSDGVLHIIIGVERGARAVLSSWIFRDEKQGFDEEPLITPHAQQELAP